MPYCHPDWAWTHTRRWHELRYVLAMQEVLDIIQQQDEAGVSPDAPHAVRWYADVFITQLAPFIEHCPQRLPELRQRIAEGRIAICGGYSNIRINHVEGETFIRSMVYGRREVHKYFPEADLSVHADLVDVALGHPQLPQLLMQAGYRYLRFWRPDEALNRKGVPSHLVWEGLDGSRVLCSRGTYGTLVSPEFIPPDFSQRWNEVVEFWKGHELDHRVALAPVPIYWLQQGTDDNRPLRTFKHLDQRLLFEDFVEEWNRRETSHMRFATPVEGFRQLEAHRQNLPTISGTLDPCDVCYNAAWSGSQGLWRLRNDAAGALLTAEALSVVAQSFDAAYPQEKLERLWKDTLLFSAHATQWLFQEDFDTLYALAQVTLTNARDLQQRALRSISREIPSDAATVASVFNPLIYARLAIVPLRVVSIKGEDGGVPPDIRLVDASGRIVPHQTINEMRHGDRVWEREVLARVELPSFGWNTIRWEPADKESNLPSSDTVTATRTSATTISLENSHTRVEFCWGQVVRIIDKDIGFEWDARTQIPFGHLSAYQVDTTAPLHVGRILGWQDVEWHTWEIAGGEPPEGSSPVFHSVRSQGKMGRHAVVQEVRLYADEGRVEFRVEIQWEGMDGFAASHMPLPEHGELHGDMPFCVEAKNIANEPYGPDAGIERQREGMFIAQSFVDWSDGTRGLAYISHDGDRYFICDHTAGERALKHILINSFRRPADTWEKDINRQIEGVGTHRFTYSLLPHAGDWRAAKMWRVAQELRTLPLVFHPSPTTQGGEAWRALMELRHDTVVCSACYREGDRVLVRVFETSGSDAEVSLTLPFDVQGVQSVNLMGDALPDLRAHGHGNTVEFHLKPWQIMTLAITVYQHSWR